MNLAGTLDTCLSRLAVRVAWPASEDVAKAFLAYAKHAMAAAGDNRKTAESILGALKRMKATTIEE